MSLEIIQKNIAYLETCEGNLAPLVIHVYFFESFVQLLLLIFVLEVTGGSKKVT